MIVVDTSALMAILLQEPQAPDLVAALEEASQALISSASVTEALSVAARRGVHPEMERLIQGLSLEIVSLNPAAARRAADAYRRWGKGFHLAALNYGDCFAYELARENDCPLLYVGGDFARTDVRSAI